jgi:hypothetical protein
MANKRCQLPDGSFRKQRKGMREQDKSSPIMRKSKFFYTFFYIDGDIRYIKV